MANPLLWPLTSLKPSVRTWDFWLCSNKLWSRDSHEAKNCTAGTFYLAAAGTTLAI